MSTTALHPAASLEALDLFAGPGGWDLAATDLGLDPLGIEWDDAAVATRIAAGLRTKQADVASLDPADFSPCELLIASPPCPTFSSAGKGDGIADMPLVYEAATAAARAKPVPPLPWRDERSALVVEPLRWAILLKPRFLCWEQVPAVLPIWEHCVGILRGKGWNVWVGILEAERYGVPQTRKRAILMADREAPVQPPRPTHQRYVKGEPQRHEVMLDSEIQPWVSMAEALGWCEGDPRISHWNAGGDGVNRPSPTVIGDPRIPDLSLTHERRKGITNPATGRPYRQMDNAIRITLEEAAILQSFPPHYPFQGTKSQRFLQAGNAVPPLLARAILSALVPAELRAAAVGVNELEAVA